MSKALNKLRTQTQVCILAYHDLSHIIAAWLQRPAPNAPSSHWKTGEDMLTLKKESKIRAHDHLHFSAINPRLDKLRLDLIPIAIRVLKRGYLALRSEAKN
uniref:Uncharacterized protein n=1 Tax=Moniliophthora roreri TaxID=221103 RepID=A0A0W0F5G9_MONRR